MKSKVAEILFRNENVKSLREERQSNRRRRRERKRGTLAGSPKRLFYLSVFKEGEKIFDASLRSQESFFSHVNMNREEERVGNVARSRA